MPWERAKPDVAALLGVLDRCGVRYVVTGSVATQLHGVPLEPGDLDVTPAIDYENLSRLAAALGEMGAELDPEEPFGRWQVGDDGQRRWLNVEPTETDRKAREEWRPRPEDPASFDHLVKTRFGALDVVPEVAGSYEELRPRAALVEVEGHSVWIESVEDQLATLTIPRRTKDADRVRGLRAVQHRQRQCDIAEPVLRDAGVFDLPFLREMLYESSFAMDEPKPPHTTIEQPQIIRYLPAFAGTGEHALIAEIGGRRVGAAWYRLFPEDDPGYGFVDASTPELSIAVSAGARGRGIGAALLRGLLRRARDDGFDAVSLSVARSNVRARRLYERLGFEVVALDEAEDGLTMRAGTRGP